MSDKKRFELMKTYYHDRVIKALGDKDKARLALDDLVSFFMEEINSILQKLNAAVLKSLKRVNEFEKAIDEVERKL